MNVQHPYYEYINEHDEVCVLNTDSIEYMTIAHEQQVAQNPKPGESDTYFVIVSTIDNAFPIIKGKRKECLKKLKELYPRISGAYSEHWIMGALERVPYIACLRKVQRINVNKSQEREYNVCLHFSRGVSFAIKKRSTRALAEQAMQKLLARYSALVH